MFNTVNATLNKLSKDLNWSKFLPCVTLAYTLSIMPAYSQQIIIDNKTNTIISTNGVTTDVSTSTVKGKNAFNSFSKFNVDNGNTVNLIVPSSSENLINIIHDETSSINGVLNSVQNGTIGGKILLVNPHGITVGSQGVINVGSLTAITPTKDFTDNFFTAGGVINDTSVEVLLSGNAPINPDAFITVEGKINAITNIKLDTGSFYSAGNIQAGSVLQVNDIDSGDIINLNNIEDGDSLTNVAGKVSIKADTIGLNNDSNITAKGMNSAGGDINITGSFVAMGGTVDTSGTSGGNINVDANLLSLAEIINAKGSDGSGGTVTFNVTGRTIETASSFIDVSGSTGGSITHIAGQQITSSGYYSALGNSGVGGLIYITAPVTKLLSTKINASGQTGGGEILLGGEYQGGKNLETDIMPNAETLIINSGVEVNASTTGTDGDGGKIIAWGDKEAIVLGDFKAIPGTKTGNGGFVEVSSGDTVTFDGTVQTGYENRSGDFLLDPKNITIGTGGAYLEYDLTIGYNYDISPANIDTDDGFGLSLSLDGTRLAIGSFHDDGFSNGNSNSGAVYLYTFTDEQFNGGTLQSIMGSGYTGGKNYNQTLDSGDEFGCSVSLDGTMIAIGAEGDKGADNGETARGAVYLYTFSDQAFSDPTYQGTIGDGYAGTKDYDLTLYAADYFAYSLNLNNNRLVVGATGDAGFDNTAFYNYSGAAYLFTFSDSAFSGATLQGTIGKNYVGTKDIDLSLDGGDYLGSSVSLDGNNLVVGASADDGYNNLNSSSGAEYLFTFTDSSFSGGSLQGIIGSGYTGSNDVNQSLTASAAFGGSSSLDGTKLAVGLYGADSYTGAVYIYNFANSDLSGGSLESQIGNGYTGGFNYDQTLESGDNFGTSVGLDNGRLAVGAYQDDGNGNALSNSGAVYLYNIATSLTPFDDQPADDVTISNTVVASLLSSPQNVTLQANNDITVSNDIIVNNGSGDGGTLTLQAGRSILINANITTDNSDLTLIGNELLSNGVVNAYRDDGFASITMNSSSTIDAGTGDVTIDLRTGAGKTYSSSDDIILNDITAASILVTNNGASDVIINSGATLTATAGGNDLVLSSANGTFINNSDANALNSNGRWLVYADNPTNTVSGGLVGSKVYNTTYDSTPPGSITQTGNRFLYSKSATINIIAGDKSRTYGDANPSLSYTATGYEDGDTSANAYSGLASITTLATQSSDAGTYAITPSIGSLESDYGYNFNYIDGDLTVNKAILTITADDKSKTYGSANPAFTATYNGFKLGQTKDNLSGSETFFTLANQNSNAGTYAINVLGFNSSNYLIYYYDGDLTVNKANLTVIADDKSKTYGAANPAFTANYSGFVLSDDQSDLGGSLNFTTPADQSSNAGTYGITASGYTSGNYNISYTDGTLTVDKANLTVTADDKSKTYGAVNPALTASYSGFVLGEDQTDLGGSLNLITPADQNSVIGSYGITASGYTSSNYNIGYADGTLTIGKADLTVNVDDKSRTYGDVNPALTASYSGFVLGQDEGVLGGSISTIATQNSDAGTYAITGSTLTSGNYNIISNDGDLTINKAILTVTADDKSKTYGSINPAFTATYNGFKLGQTKDDLGGSEIFFTLADQNSDVGTYAINVLGLSSPNYLIYYYDGDLTINPANLTVTANDTARLYGAANPAFDATFTGLVAGDQPSDYNPTFNTAAVVNSDIGDYTIIASNVNDANYNINYVNGTLTINPADLLITADDKVKTYGAPNPTSTATYTGLVAGDQPSDFNLSFINEADVNSNAGNYFIQPLNFTGNNYNITYVDGTLTINPADLLITADDKAKTYGAANPALTSTFTGLVAGDQPSDYNPTINTIANANTGAGNYDINISGVNDPNYNINFVKGILTINPANLTVTANDNARLYGDANPAFDATFTGLVAGDQPSDYNPSFNTAAVVNSNIGNYAIVASNVNDANYNINYVDGTLTINPADLLITADNQSKTYGAANPALTATYTGLVADDQPSDYNPTINTAADINTGVGGYDINISGVIDTNYNINYTKGTLTINPADLLITADDKSKTYGTANPALTSTFTGLVASDQPSDYNPTINTAADVNTGVGGYDINISGVIDPNYNISYAKGTLTINPADLQITADNKSKIYGEANPAFTTTFTGLVAGDQPGDYNPTINTIANTNTGVGNYDINVSGVVDPNYNINFVKGTLTINPADLTVTANNKTRLYGAANPAFDATFTGLVAGDQPSDYNPSFNTAAVVNSNVANYNIVASNINDANYNINYIDGTLTINPTDLLITANDKSKTYGATNPAFTATYTGLVADDQPSDYNPTYVTPANVNTAIGNYDINVSGVVDANYNINYAKGTLTINPADLLITANDKSKTYGTANPTLTSTFTGLVAGDQPSDYSPTINTIANVNTDAGNYDINVSGVNDPNYNINYAKGTLTINPADLLITANDKSKNYGTANPTFSAIFTGLVSNDKQSDYNPTYITLANTSTDAGTYDINVLGVNDPNYNISYAKGTLTIDPVNLTITTDDLSRFEGEPNPAFTATYDGFVLDQDPSSLSGKLEFNTNATQSSPAGTYLVTPYGQTSNNYNITYNDGHLVVLFDANHSSSGSESPAKAVEVIIDTVLNNTTNENNGNNDSNESGINNLNTIINTDIVDNITTEQLTKDAEDIIDLLGHLNSDLTMVDMENTSEMTSVIGDNSFIQLIIKTVADDPNLQENKDLTSKCIVEAISLFNQNYEGFMAGDLSETEVTQLTQNAINKILQDNNNQ